MNKIGLLLPDLSPTQLAYFAVRRANDRAQRAPLLDVTLFVERAVPPCVKPATAVMPAHEVWAFDGPVVATTWQTARLLLECPRPYPKAFYVWDLEWLRMGVFPFEVVSPVYLHGELRLIARSHSHAWAIQAAWDRECVVSEDFDLEPILACLAN